MGNEVTWGRTGTSSKLFLKQ